MPTPRRHRSAARAWTAREKGSLWAPFFMVRLSSWAEWVRDPLRASPHVWCSCLARAFSGGASGYCKCRLGASNPFWPPHAVCLRDRVRLVYDQRQMAGRANLRHVVEEITHESIRGGADQARLFIAETMPQRNRAGDAQRASTGRVFRVHAGWILVVRGAHLNARPKRYGPHPFAPRSARQEFPIDLLYGPAASGLDSGPRKRGVGVLYARRPSKTQMSRGVGALAKPSDSMTEAS